MKAISKIEDAITEIVSMNLYTKDEMIDISELLVNLNKKIVFTKMDNYNDKCKVGNDLCSSYVLFSKDSVFIKIGRESNSFKKNEIKIANKIILDSKDEQTAQDNIRNYIRLKKFIDRFHNEQASLLDFGIKTFNDTQTKVLQEYQISFDCAQTSNELILQNGRDEIKRLEYYTGDYTKNESNFRQLILAARIDFIERSNISSLKELTDIVQKIITLSHNTFQNNPTPIYLDDNFRYTNTDIDLEENYIQINSKHKGAITPSITINLKDKKDLNAGLVMTSNKLRGEYDQDSDFYKEITSCINKAQNFHDLQNQIENLIQLEKPKNEKKREDALKAESQKSIDAMKLDLQKKRDAFYTKGTGADKYLKKPKNSKIGYSSQKNPNKRRASICLMTSICLILTVLTLAYFEIISFPIALVGVFVSCVPFFVSCCLNASDITGRSSRLSLTTIDNSSF